MPIRHYVLSTANFRAKSHYRGMRTVLISTTILGLCAAAMAAPINAGTTVIDMGEGWSGPSSVPGVEELAPEFHFTMSWMDGSPFGQNNSGRIHSMPAASPRVPAPEPSVALIFLAALLSFAFAAALRSAPDVRRWLKGDRRQARRRRVKVEIRMMA